MDFLLVEGAGEQGKRVYVDQYDGVPVDGHLLVDVEGVLSVEGVRAGVPCDVYPVVVDRLVLARPMMWGMLSRGVWRVGWGHTWAAVELCLELVE